MLMFSVVFFFIVSKAFTLPFLLVKRTLDLPTTGFRTVPPVPGMVHHGSEQIGISSLCLGDLFHNGKTEWNEGLCKSANHILCLQDWFKDVLAS